jgi:hypothetical protein
MIAKVYSAAVVHSRSLGSPTINFQVPSGWQRDCVHPAEGRARLEGFFERVVGEDGLALFLAAVAQVDSSQKRRRISA